MKRKMKATSYILGIVTGIVFMFAMYKDRIMIESFPVRQLERDSVITSQKVIIDSLRRTRTIIVYQRDSVNKRIEYKLQWIDSLSNVTVTDSLLEKSILWVKEQNK